MEYLTLTNSTEIIRIASEDIVFIKGEGNYSDIYLSNGKAENVTYQLYEISELLLSAKHSDLKFDLLICRTADYIHVYPHVYRRKNCLLSRNQANWGTFQST
mgnify:CR=1 FL=1